MLSAGFAGPASRLADETVSFAEHLPSLHHLKLRIWTQPILGWQNLRTLCTHSLFPYPAMMDVVETLSRGAQTRDGEEGDSSAEARREKAAR